jgi:hypothetical protein
MKIHKRLQWVAIGFCILLLCGCAAMPMPGEQEIVKSPVIAPQDGKAMVYFFRESMFTGSGVSYYVFDGQEKIGASWTGCYFVAPISPGQHTFWGETEDKKYITLDIEPGKDYYISMAVTVGILCGLPEFSLVTGEVALPLIKNIDYCRLVKLPEGNMSPIPTGMP